MPQRISLRRRIDKLVFLEFHIHKLLSTYQGIYVLEGGGTTFTIQGGVRGSDRFFQEGNTRCQVEKRNCTFAFINRSTRGVYLKKNYCSVVKGVQKFVDEGIVFKLMPLMMLMFVDLSLSKQLTRASSHASQSVNSQ